MSMRTKYREKRGRRSHGPPFVQVYLYILKSPAWLALSCNARAAYLQLASRYNGTNNGYLALSARILAQEMNCSPQTASRALIELEDAGFIETTFLASFTLRKDRKASEYRLTVYRCDRTGEPPSKKFMRWHSSKFAKSVSTDGTGVHAIRTNGSTYGTKSADSEAKLVPPMEHM
jgi:hypothetical protein